MPVELEEITFIFVLLSALPIVVVSVSSSVVFSVVLSFVVTSLFALPSVLRPVELFCSCVVVSVSAPAPTEDVFVDVPIDLVLP